jgi:hypothetical protein
MSTVLLPPGVDPIAVKYISYAVQRSSLTVTNWCTGRCRKSRMEKVGKPKKLAVADDTSNHIQHQDTKPNMEQLIREASNTELHPNSMKRQDSLTGHGNIYEV